MPLETNADTSGTSQGTRGRTEVQDDSRELGPTPVKLKSKYMNLTEIRKLAEKIRKAAKNPNEPDPLEEANKPLSEIIIAVAEVDDIVVDPTYIPPTASDLKKMRQEGRTNAKKCFDNRRGRRVPVASVDPVAWLQMQLRKYDVYGEQVRECEALHGENQPPMLITFISSIKKLQTDVAYSVKTAIKPDEFDRLFPPEKYDPEWDWLMDSDDSPTKIDPTDLVFYSRMSGLFYKKTLRGTREQSEELNEIQTSTDTDIQSLWARNQSLRRERASDFADELIKVATFLDELDKLSKDSDSVCRKCLGNAKDERKAVLCYKIQELTRKRWSWTRKSAIQTLTENNIDLDQILKDSAARYRPEQLERVSELLRGSPSERNTKPQTQSK